MTAIRGIWAARVGGGLVGIAAAAAILIASHPAQGGAAVGAEVSAHADQTGALALSPAGPSDFLHIRALRPGETASGSFTITNQTGERQAARIRALPSDRKLAGVVTLSFSGGGRLLLPPGGSAAVEATASIASDAGERWQAALVDFAVLLDSKDSR